MWRYPQCNSRVFNPVPAAFSKTTGIAGGMSRHDCFAFGVDLDGVVGNHSKLFRKVVARELGVPVQSLPREHDWNSTEWGLQPGMFPELDAIAVEHDRMFLNMEPTEGAVDAISELAEAGVCIRIVTHRLCVPDLHAITAGDTVKWLDDIELSYRELCFTGHKSSVGSDISIGDAPHNVEALRKSGVETIIFDQP